MELKLINQSFFDLETLGIDVGKDRIVEISFKVFPNGNKESKTWLVNPFQFRRKQLRYMESQMKVRMNPLLTSWLRRFIL
jgi:hypothetical protein